MDILIDREIGEDFWDDGSCVSSSDVYRQLSEAEKSGGRALRVVVDSPGGSVWEGVSIYNVIREFCRTHADWSVETYIRGMAASMASVVALAASAVNPNAQVVCEDNSAFMIHKAWGLCVGNADEMRRQSDLLSRIDSLLVSAYSRKSARAEAEIREMMAAETWLFGAEIVAAGFADEVVPSGASVDGAELRGVASARWSACRAKVQAMAARSPGRSLDAVALALGAGGGDGDFANKDMEVSAMTLEEFKAQNPALFGEISDSARKEGAEAERGRAARLLAMAEKAGGGAARAYALKCISDGGDPSDAAVVDAFMDFGAAARVLGAQSADSAVPDVVPPRRDGCGDDGAYFDRLNAAMFG